jgi:hypothetical protein
LLAGFAFAQTTPTGTASLKPSPEGASLAHASADPRLLAPFREGETPRAGEPRTSIVKLADGSLLTVDGNTTVRSRDLGRTWGERLPVCPDAATGPGIPIGPMQLIRTQKDTLVLIWRDERIDDWNKATWEMGPKASGAVWTMRSVDGGKTWGERQKIFDGVCAHPPINLLELQDGSLVVPVQYFTNGPLRCVIRPYVSQDDGKTWTGRNIIDLGGHGHHDGAIEPSLVELRDGRVWMLIRTNYDRYWEAISDDHGLNWRTIRPSGIEASSSPPYLLRLASGRLLLFWNRLFPEGQTSYSRRADHFSEVAGSWHREELSVAWSEDDGATWSKPRIIAREKDKWLSYPYGFEPEPGKIWIFSGQGNLAATITEAELTGAH